MFSSTFIILYSILFGYSMKIADLLNEHGLVWFNGSNLIFGILWGMFGSLLILSNATLANIMIAMSLAFLVRNRLDYFNHQIAAVMILITFLLTTSIQPLIFFAFLIIFILFGGIRDHIGDKVAKKNFLHKAYDRFMWYYPIPAFVYCLMYGDWIIFFSLLCYSVAYDFTKELYRRKGVS